VLPFFNRLVVLLVFVWLRGLPLDVGVNLFVLRIEVGHVDAEILQDKHEHERGDDTLVVIVSGHCHKASQLMAAVNVH